MRWEITKERDTYLLYARVLTPLVGDQVTVVNSICGLHRLPCEGPQWSNSRKSRFLINMSKNLNRKFLHLSIFKTIYLMTQLQNIGEFGCVVCHLVCPLVRASEKFFSFSKRYWGKDDYTFNLLTCFYLNHTYYKLRLC